MTDDRKISLKDLTDDPSLMIGLAKRGRSDEGIERNVEDLIKDSFKACPSDGVYFDPIHGWTMPGDVHQSDTYRSLKEIAAELKSDAPDDLFDDVERLFFDYLPLIRQGIRERFGQHPGVSWYMTAEKNRAFVSFQDGPHAEWQHGCYADEVPLWLLVGLVRKITAGKPLGHQKTDETIAKIDDLDAQYMSTKDARELERNLGALNLGGDDDDE
jgi:hypothetical protein